MWSQDHDMCMRIVLTEATSSVVVLREGAVPARPYAKAKHEMHLLSREAEQPHDHRTM
jgi:hypothetical protein